MLLIAAAALAASVPPPSGVTARATASVRILSAATIHFDAPAPDLPKLRVAQLRAPTGEPQTIRLIEFE